MDEFSINFGRHRIMGCPWHGLVRGSRLTLPNGQHKDNQWLADNVRASYRVAVPGVPPVVRDADEVAADTAAGYQWRSDAVVNLRGNDQSLFLYGRLGFNGSALYAPAIGNCWAVKMPYSVTSDAGKTQLVQPATLERFGHVTTASSEPDERPVTVTLSGYDPADAQDTPQALAITWDSLPDGSQVIRGAAVYDAAAGQYVPAAGFDLLRLSGAGTAESPFAAVLEKLSGVLSGASTWTDNFQTWSGVIDWVPAMSQEWIAPLDDQSGQDCQWFKVTTTGSTLTLDPNGIPSAVSPFLSVTTGVREATLLDHVIGWWFLNGVPVPVTLDIEYELTEEHDLAGNAAGASPRIRIWRYVKSGGQCVPSPYPGDIETYNSNGSFAFSGTMARSTTERLTRRLKVGGVLIDAAEIVYEKQTTETLGGTGVLFDSGDAPDGGTVDFVTVQRLIVDGEVIDSHTATSTGDDTGFGISGPYVITRAIDTSNRFTGVLPVADWLPILSGGSLPADVASVKWACRVHWWSNHLVCLLRRQSPYSGLTGLSLLYGHTAYPGGVAGPISVPAPSPATNAQYLFGAHDSLTGTVLLGQSEKVTYV